MTPPIQDSPDDAMLREFVRTQSTISSFRAVARRVGVHRGTLQKFLDGSSPRQRVRDLLVRDYREVHTRGPAPSPPSGNEAAGPEQSIATDTLREFARREISHSSLGRFSARVGLPRQTIHGFVNGASPHARVRRRLQLEYVATQDVEAQRAALVSIVGQDDDAIRIAASAIRASLEEHGHPIPPALGLLNEKLEAAELPPLSAEPLLTFEVVVARIAAQARRTSIRAVARASGLSPEAVRQTINGSTRKHQPNKISKLRRYAAALGAVEREEPSPAPLDELKAFLVCRVKRFSVKHVAKELGVSPLTVTRFTQRSSTPHERIVLAVSGLYGKHSEQLPRYKRLQVPRGDPSASPEELEAARADLRQVAADWSYGEIARGAGLDTATVWGFIHGAVPTPSTWLRIRRYWKARRLEQRIPMEEVHAWVQQLVRDHGLKGTAERLGIGLGAVKNLREAKVHPRPKTLHKLTEAYRREHPLQHHEGKSDAV
jgi:transcriptional regulator with XRE-family HTH domain